MKFMVQVKGIILVDAEDKDTAKHVAEGILASKLPWLSTDYGTPTRIADKEEIEAFLELEVPVD